MEEKAVQTVNENALRLAMMTGMPISELGVQDAMVIPNKWLLTMFRHQDGNAACIPTLIDGSLCKTKAGIIEHLKPSLRDTFEYLKFEFNNQADGLIEKLLRKITENLLLGQNNVIFSIDYPDKKNQPILTVYIEKTFEVPFKDYGVFDKNAVFAFNVINRNGKEVPFIYANDKRQVGFFQQFYLGLYCLNEISDKEFLKKLTDERVFSKIQDKLDLSKKNISEMRKNDAQKEKGTVQFTDYEYNCMEFVVDTLKLMLVAEEDW